MRGLFGGRQSIGGIRVQGISFTTGRVINPKSDHAADPNTGCICSDGLYHRCLDCPEPDCTLHHRNMTCRGTSL